jgi:hypothetical protein
MKASEIFNKFWLARNDINLNIRDRKFLFKINLCEDFNCYESQTSYKFKYMNFNSFNEIELIDKKHKVVKTLNEENVVWISSIYYESKGVDFKVCDFNYTKLDKGDDTNE